MIDRTRGQSLFLSHNSSRESSIHFNALSIYYAEKVQAQANISIWAEQIDNESSQLLSLLYVIVKEEKNISTNITSKNELIYILYAIKTVNMYLLQVENNINLIILQEIGLSIVFYTINQSIYLQLWNGCFCPISLFSINEIQKKMPRTSYTHYLEWQSSSNNVSQRIKQKKYFSNF